MELNLLPSRPLTTPRRRGRPSAQETHDLTAYILAVAKSRFLEVGYDATSIDEIIDRAKISNQTFYNRFSNKSCLFEGVLREFSNNIIDERGRIDPELLDMRIEVALREFAVRFLRKVLNSEALEFERLLIMTVKQYPKNSAIVRSASEALAEMVGILLTASKNRGEIRVVNVRRCSNWFVEGSISPRLKRSSFGLAGLELTRADIGEIDAYVAFFLRALDFGTLNQQNL